MVKGVVFGYVVIFCMVIMEEVFDMFKDDFGNLMSYFCDILIYVGCVVGFVVVLENMCIVEDENLFDNMLKMGVWLMDNLEVLKDKYVVVGDVCGCGLFVGIELVVDWYIKELVDEVKVQVVVGYCMM